MCFIAFTETHKKHISNLHLHCVLLCVFLISTPILHCVLHCVYKNTFFPYGSLRIPMLVFSDVFCGNKNSCSIAVIERAKLVCFVAFIDTSYVVMLFDFPSIGSSFSLRCLSSPSLPRLPFHHVHYLFSNSHSHRFSAGQSLRL